SIPDDRRLPLVGDADGGDVAGTQVRPAERLRGDGDLGRPDLAGVVFDPARTGKDLREFALADGDDVRVVIEDDRARAGCPLIERENVRHASPSETAVARAVFYRQRPATACRS